MGSHGPPAAIFVLDLESTLMNDAGEGDQGCMVRPKETKHKHAAAADSKPVCLLSTRACFACYACFDCLHEKTLRCIVWLVCCLTSSTASVSCTSSSNSSSLCQPIRACCSALPRTHFQHGSLRCNGPIGVPESSKAHSCCKPYASSLTCYDSTSSTKPQGIYNTAATLQQSTMFKDVRHNVSVLGTGVW